MVMVTWKDFKKEEWEIIFDIIEFEESCYWAEYLSYINLSDFRVINGKRWIDYIKSNSLDKSFLRDLIKAIEFNECMDILGAVTIKRRILDR